MALFADFPYTVHSAALEVLEALLGIQSTSDVIKSVDKLLERGDEEVRPYTRVCCLLY
jgi:hypothetical protein